tara:strand:+ start:717 stop:1646 length:930 start_codon:yes stop_codon:yes gene_type:complete
MLINKQDEKDFQRFVIKEFRDTSTLFAITSICLPIFSLMFAYYLSNNLNLLNSFWLIPLIGWIYYKMYFPLHDLAHMNLFKSSLLNKIFGNIISSFFATPFESFRSEHIDHHKYHGTDKDPARNDYDFEIKNRYQFLIFLFGPLFGSTIFQKFRDHYTGYMVKNNSKKTFDLLSFLFVIIIQFLILLYFYDGIIGLVKYFMYVILPGITVFLFLSRFRQFLEHYEHAENINITSDEKKVSRTFKLSTIENFLLSGYSFKYHFEHHKYPSVPAPKLPKLHELYIKKFQINEQLVDHGYITQLKKIWNKIT